MIMPASIVNKVTCPILMTNVQGVCVFSQAKPTQVKSRPYRSPYTKEDMILAYNAVKEKGLPIYAAPQTLRDRLTGVVNYTNDAAGANPLLSTEEEQTIVDHVEVKAQLGYGYSHIQLQHLEGELPHDFGRLS